MLANVSFWHNYDLNISQKISSSTFIWSSINVIAFKDNNMLNLAVANEESWKIHLQVSNWEPCLSIPDSFLTRPINQWVLKNNFRLPSRNKLEFISPKIRDIRLSKPSAFYSNFNFLKLIYFIVHFVQRCLNVSRWYLGFKSQ